MLQGPPGDSVLSTGAESVRVHVFVSSHRTSQNHREQSGRHDHTLTDDVPGPLPFLPDLRDHTPPVPVHASCSSTLRPPVSRVTAVHTIEMSNNLCGERVLKLCKFRYINIVDHHFYLPVQLVGGFTLSDLLDKPWSQVSSLSTPGTCL